MDTSIPPSPWWCHLPWNRRWLVQHQIWTCLNMRMSAWPLGVVVIASPYSKRSPLTILNVSYFFPSINFCFISLCCSINYFALTFRIINIQKRFLFLFIYSTCRYFQGPFGPVGQKGQVSDVIAFIYILLLLLYPGTSTWTCSLQQVFYKQQMSF